MKSRSESLIRLKKFQVDEKRRQVSQIEMMVADFERMASELDQQIEIERPRPVFRTWRISPIPPLPRRR